MHNGIFMFNNLILDQQIYRLKVEAALSSLPFGSLENSFPIFQIHKMNCQKKNWEKTLQQRSKIQHQVSISHFLKQPLSSLNSILHNFIVKRNKESHILSYNSLLKLPTQTSNFLYLVQGEKKGKEKLACKLKLLNILCMGIPQIPQKLQTQSLKLIYGYSNHHFEVHIA